MTQTIDIDDARCSIRRLQRTGNITAILLALAVGGWAYNAEISGAVIAQGQVVVETSRKKVQHPGGGIVGEILARNGDTVSAGQILVRLDATFPKANLDIVSKQLNELIAQRARLIAERDGRNTVNLPTLFTGWRLNPDIVKAVKSERKLFELRRRSRIGRKEQLERRKQQILNSIDGLRIQADAKANELQLLQRELKGVRQLHKKGLMAINRLTVLERQHTQLEGESGNFVTMVARAKAKLAETELQILQVDQDLASTVGQELREVDLKIGELRERQLAAKVKLQRFEIRSPESGIVTQSRVHTVGGVIGSGETIMEIVPQNKQFVIEVKIAPHDIDQVRMDQSALLRLSALNQRTTPELNGRVVLVSPDAVQDTQTGESHYIARVEIPKDERARLGDVRLIPGMPVEAFLKTHDRSVLSYLMKPLTDQFQRVFRES
ncbi:MAG: HlyD family type I secretion periplasmic adaptor subunit [Pseudomonadota bacterium]